MVAKGQEVVQQAVPVESFWHFVQAFPGSLTFQLFLALTAAGLVGMFGNYLQQWARKEIEGSLWCYAFHQNVRGTVYSICCMLSLNVTAIQMDLFVTQGLFIGWTAVLWMGILNGFGADALANRGKRPVWTPFERQQERQQQVTEKGKP